MCWSTVNFKTKEDDDKSKFQSDGEDTCRISEGTAQYHYN